MHQYQQFVQEIYKWTVSLKTIGKQTTTNYYFIPLSQNSHHLCLSFSHQSSVAVAGNDKFPKIEMGGGNLPQWLAMICEWLITNRDLQLVEKNSPDVVDHDGRGVWLGNDAGSKCWCVVNNLWVGKDFGWNWGRVEEIRMKKNNIYINREINIAPNIWTRWI